MVVQPTGSSEPPTAAGGETARVFLALFPAPDQRRALGDLAQECAEHSGGRAVPAANLHLTLAFLGELRPPQLRAVCDIAAAMALAPFEMVFDRVGFWRKRGIVWAGCGETPAALVALVEDLRAGLGRVGFQVETRPYVAHITLVRKARRSPQVRMAPLVWPVTDFCLVRSTLSRSAAHYEVIERWPDGRPA